MPRAEDTCADGNLFSVPAVAIPSSAAAAAAAAPHTSSMAHGCGGGKGGAILEDGRVRIRRPPRTPRAIPSSVARERSNAPTAAPPARCAAVGGTATTEATGTRERRHRHHCEVVRTQPSPSHRGLRSNRAGDLGAPSHYLPIPHNMGAVRNPSSAIMRHTFLGVLWRDLLPTAIAGYLTVGDLVAVGAVCRAARQAVRLPCVWRTVAVSSYGVARPEAVEALCAQQHDPINALAADDDALPYFTASPTPSPVDGEDDEGQQTRETERLRELDSQMPSPCERGGSMGSAPASPSTPTTAALTCQAAGDSPLRCNDAHVGLTGCGGREGHYPRSALAATCFVDTPPPAGSAMGTSPPPFPWESYVRFLHRGRVRELLHHLRRQECERVEDSEGCVAVADRSPSAMSPATPAAPQLLGTAAAPVRDSRRSLIGKLTYSINVLTQRPTDGGGLPAEHVAYLADSLLARGRLLLALAHDNVGESEGGKITTTTGHRPSSLLSLALEDLAMAELLRPEDSALTALVDETVVRLEAERGHGGGAAAAALPVRSFADWLAEGDAAAQQPRLFAVFAVSRRLQFHLTRPDQSRDMVTEVQNQDHQRLRQQQLLFTHLSTYLHVLETLGLSLAHLMVKAAALAVSPLEHLTVNALRHLSRCLAHEAANDGAAVVMAAAAEAVGCVEMAVCLLPCAERAAVAAAARAWEANWLLNPSITLSGMVGEGLTRYGAHIATTAADGMEARAMDVETVALLSLAYCTAAVAHGRQSGCGDPVLRLPNSTPPPPPPPFGYSNSSSSATSTLPSPVQQNVTTTTSAAAHCEVIIRYLALSRCHYQQAAMLTRLAALYVDRDENGALPCHPDGDGEDRLPMPALTAGADGTPTGGVAATGVVVALRLLHTAVHLSPTCVPAHLMLARLYAQQERGEQPSLPPFALSAYHLLSHCLHCYAQPFLPANNADGADTDTLSYLRRRERHPSRCYIPAELLSERSRVLRSTRGRGASLLSSPTSPDPPASLRQLLSYTGHAAISHRSLADVYEAVLHHPCASYPRQVKAAAALDAATHARPAPPLHRHRNPPLDGDGPSEGHDDSSFRSLFSAADKELSEVMAFRLQESDVALRLRFLADCFERWCGLCPDGTAAAAAMDDERGGQSTVTRTGEARARRLQMQMLHQLGLLAVLTAGRAGVVASSSSPYFPPHLQGCVGEGVGVFIVGLTQAATDQQAER